MINDDFLLNGILQNWPKNCVVLCGLYVHLRMFVIVLHVLYIFWES